MIKDIFKKKSPEELKEELKKLVSVHEKDRDNMKGWPDTDEWYKERLKETLEELDEYSEKIVTATADYLPNMKIDKILGVAEGISYIQISNEKEFELSEKQAFLNMIKEAEKKGANAIIAIRLVPGTYQMQGSGWQISQFVYTGTAVLAHFE